MYALCGRILALYLLTWVLLLVVLQAQVIESVKLVVLSLIFMQEKHSLLGHSREFLMSLSPSVTQRPSPRYNYYRYLEEPLLI